MPCLCSLLIQLHCVLLSYTCCGVAEDSQPGDAVYLEGQAPTTTFPKTLKSDFWKKIVAELKVQSHTACFAKQKLVTDRGTVHVESSIPDDAGIH